MTFGMLFSFAKTVAVLLHYSHPCSLGQQKSAQLVKRCTTLLNFINEQSSSLVGTDSIAAFDEVEA